MGKATRVKRENARERIAAQRAAQRKREMRNRMLWTGGSILGVIVIVVAFIVIKTTQNPASTNSSGSTSAAGTALPASVIKDVTSVPAATLAAVGGRDRRREERDHGVLGQALDRPAASRRCSTSAPSTARTARPSGGPWPWRSAGSAPSTA